MKPTVLRERSSAPLVLTCEHASPAVPDDLAGLGLDAAALTDHIGWDIGAAQVTVRLSELLTAPAVLSAVNRLVVDCNRQLTDHDLIPEVSHGVVIAGNARLDDGERSRRIGAYYEPFHDQVDVVLERESRALLLSVHSFTPGYDGRDFDIGVLFDDHQASADALAGELRGQGFAVRMNEPYSGFEGLIHSARSHGIRAGCTYLEIEINNRLVLAAAASKAIADRIARALSALLGG